MTAASPRSIAYLTSLMSERVAMADDGTVDPLGRTIAAILAEAGQDMDALVAAMPQRKVSELIDRYKRHPRPARNTGNGNATACPEGMHRIADGTIYKVYTTQTSGHLAAKRLVIVDDGNGTHHGEFEYERSAIRTHRLGADTLLDHTEAARFGALYGFCCNCGKVLETEESLHAGYGPTCARRYGWPWGTRQQVAAK